MPSLNLSEFIPPCNNRSKRKQLYFSRTTKFQLTTNLNENYFENKGGIENGNGFEFVFLLFNLIWMAAMNINRRASNFLIVFLFKPFSSVPTLLQWFCYDPDESVFFPHNFVIHAIFSFQCMIYIITKKYVVRENVYFVSKQDQIFWNHQFCKQTTTDGNTHVT